MFKNGFPNVFWVGGQILGQKRIMKKTKHTGDMSFLCGKLSELNFNSQLSPNRGETVLEYETISLTQDLSTTYVLQIISTVNVFHLKSGKLIYTDKNHQDIHCF